jgi:hypothetical protein
MDENQFVNVTAYYAEPAKIFSVPAHYSLDDIQEAIRSEMGTGTSRDPSLITIAYGEFSSISPTPRPWSVQRLGRDKHFHWANCIERRVNRCNHLLDAKFGIKFPGPGDEEHKGDFPVTKPVTELNHIAVNFRSMYEPPPYVS